MKITLSLITALVMVIGAFSFSAHAQMTSETYQVQFDSVNIGGERGTSTNYVIEDTTGEVATGNSTSTNYALHAGYQQMNESIISISAEADVILPNMSGITADASTSSSSWTVITDSPSGYELSVKASSSPALAVPSGPSINDYEPQTANPDFAFSIDATEAAFGYTVEGTDIADRFRDDGNSCNTDSGDTADRCWDGFSTSDTVISKRTSGNHPNGTETTLKYRAENGSNNLLEAGDYEATITVTAVTL